MKDAIGPPVIDAFEGESCKSLKKLCCKVKSSMLRSQGGAKTRDMTYNRCITPPGHHEYIDDLGGFEQVIEPQTDSKDIHEPNLPS